MLKSMRIRLLAAALCLALLCGCGTGNNAADQDNAAGNDTQQEGGDNASGDEKEEEPPAVKSVPMSEETLQQWEAFFNDMENNGLLRFPYADLSGNPEQLVPYLELLFYDLGDPGSEISQDEMDLLAQRDFRMETDLFRMSREFVTEYLLDKLGIPAGVSESLLDEGFGLESYLLEYDAWYKCHGDANWRQYDLERGEEYEDGTIKLYYYAEFVPIVQENGEKNSVDAHMVVTLTQKNGAWIVLANEFVEIVKEWDF